MPVCRLETMRVEKAWGRRDLWARFEDVPDGAPPVGEIWFQVPNAANRKDPELLIKYLFTSDRLSVQVHPDDASARARGHARGKSEAWLILQAEPQATIAIGTTKPMTRDELRLASQNGSIEHMLDWKAVQADEFWYSPAGTVHAIGRGLMLVEIQQNIDLTYRLYDYGSDRELHMEDGVAVSDPVPYVAPFQPVDLAPGRRLLAAGGAFVVERWTAACSGCLEASPERPLWLVPLKGQGTLDGNAISPGEVWIADDRASLGLAGEIDLLVCYPGGAVIDTVLS